MDDLLVAGANLLLNVNKPSLPSSPKKSAPSSAVPSALALRAASVDDEFFLKRHDLKANGASVSVPASSTLVTSGAPVGLSNISHIHSVLPPSLDRDSSLQYYNHSHISRPDLQPVNSILSTAPSSLVLASGIPNTPVASGLNGVSSTGGAISIRVAASENGRTHSHERQRDHNGNGSSNSICSSSSSNGAGSGSDNSHDAATPQTASEAGKKANANGKKRSAPNDFDKELIAKFRKESHSALEQRRRDKINDGINQLKELVEPYHNGKYDKASVLRKSIEYIQQVNEGLNSLRELLDPHDVSKHNRVNTLRKSSEYIKQAQHLQRRLVEENYALREDNGQLQACLDVIRTENRLLRIEITKLRPELQHLRAEDEDTMAKVVEASKAKSEISVPSSSPSPPLASSSSVSSGASSVASFFSTSVRPPLHASWLESVALAKTHSPPYSKKHMIERTESNMSSVHS